jgi:hypothetical protein
MQLRAITQKSALAAIMLLVVILIAAAIRSRLNPFELELANSAFLERTISLVTAMFLLFCVGIIEGKMFPRSGLNKGYCTLPIPLYGILSIGIFVAPNTLAAATASLCFALAIYLLLRSLHSAGEKDSLLFASLLLGGSILIYPPCVVFIGILIPAIFMLALSFRQIIIILVGYLLPLFGASYYMWYQGDSFWSMAHNIADSLLTPQMGGVEQLPYMGIIMICAIIALLVGGLIFSIIRPDKIFMLARVKRTLSLFVWILLVTLTMLIFPSCDLTLLALIAVPASILLSFVLGILPATLSTIAYWVILLLFAVHLFVG